MKWTLGPIESLFVTEERVLLATGVVLLVMLVLLARRLSAHGAGHERHGSDSRQHRSHLRSNQRFTTGGNGRSQ